MLSLFGRETSLAALGPISYGEPGHMAALRPLFCCEPVIKYGLYIYKLILIIRKTIFSII